MPVKRSKAMIMQRGPIFMLALMVLQATVNSQAGRGAGQQRSMAQSTKLKPVVWCVRFNDVLVSRMANYRGCRMAVRQSWVK